MAFSSAKEIFEKMPEVFSAANAAGVNTTFQFHLTGAEAGDWNVVVKDGACSVNQGVHESPSVTLTLADQDWVGICNGTLNPMTAFMTGKLKASGDIMAAQRLSSLFPMR